MALQWRGPEDKWRFFFWLPMQPEFLDFWRSHIPNIKVSGQLIQSDGSFTNLQFVGNTHPLTVNIGTEQYETQYAEFRANIQLTEKTPIVCVASVCYLVHPLDVPSMEFSAYDICLGSWEFQIQSKLSDGFEIWGMIPITSRSDVKVSKREILGNSGRIRMEAAPDSLILPQDTVLFMFRSPTQHSDGPYSETVVSVLANGQPAMGNSQ